MILIITPFPPSPHRRSTHHVETHLLRDRHLHMRHHLHDGQSLRRHECKAHRRKVTPPKLAPKQTLSKRKFAETDIVEKKVRRNFSNSVLSTIFVVMISLSAIVSPACFFKHISHSSMKVWLKKENSVLFTQLVID
jgi:hypothetical protein